MYGVLFLGVGLLLYKRVSEPLTVIHEIEKQTLTESHSEPVPQPFGNSAGQSTEDLTKRREGQSITGIR